ncbi:hypothetical protein [Flavobacterium sp. GT3R68]|uniref:hypothetical protein n=1 Tax=Flavobacterium sp. GT3R68 TaxID=2594437 RepID=UPI000F8724BF|nr:hypothetical protein [Flavobacterium sp. GT3R68]RTY85665.1 hypothetical protein EKL32_28400 [Flavobacterium sp. GSN2]TRW90051.1 hypothetical protein FNW07_11360 [Flavobacterium sp. GT3R68]
MNNADNKPNKSKLLFGIATSIFFVILGIYLFSTATEQIDTFHAGFSESQYFYSDDSKQTLLVRYGEIQNLPTQLQKEIDKSVVSEIEAELPKPTKGEGSYRYYNSFCCPHCSSPFIDFQKNRQIRPNEYYGNKYINEKIYTIDDNQLAEK